VVCDLVFNGARRDVRAQDTEGEKRQESDGDEIKEQLDPYASILQRFPP